MCYSGSIRSPSRHGAATKAQLKFAELRLGQMSDLASKQAGHLFDGSQYS